MRVSIRVARRRFAWSYAPGVSPSEAAASRAVKVPRIVISQVLNHAEGGVTSIYDRHSYLDEKRHALDAWARHVETLVRPQPDNVVEIVGKR